MLRLTIAQAVARASNAPAAASGLQIPGGK
jgi:hypothetical protein